MKQLAKVTLCIPVYNAEKTIIRTLESLIAQDYPIFKIKIFDNISTDKSAEICRNFSSKYSFIELYENETNVGAEANFTKCIQAADGDYTALVHSDDIYESTFVSKSVMALESSGNCVAAFCDAFEINATERITGKRFMPSELTKKEITYLDHKELLKLIFKYSNFITCPSVMVRSSCYLDKIKTWNGGEFKTSADLEVWLRLSSLGEIAAINSPLIKYRVADASYSYRIAKKRTTKHDVFLVLDKYKNESNISDYNFLVLKDQAIRSLNIIRNNKREECFPCDFEFKIFSVIKKMCHSKWHLKMGLAIIGINVLVGVLIIAGWNRKCLK